MSRPLIDRRLSSQSAEAAASILRRSPDLAPISILPRPKQSNTRDQRIETALKGRHQGWTLEDSPTNSMMASNASSPIDSPRKIAQSTSAPSSIQQLLDTNGEVALSSVRFAYGSQVHSLLLSSDLSPIESQNIIKSVFKLSEDVVGIYDPSQQLVLPFSLVTKSPATFDGIYYLVLKQSGVQYPQGVANSSAESSMQSSPMTSPESSPSRPNNRTQPIKRNGYTSSSQSNQALSTYTSQPRASRHAVNAAYQKAQQLARVASASPTASSLDDSEVDEDDEDDYEPIGDSLNGDSDLSSDMDQESVDEEAEQAAFERAVDRAMAAEAKHATAEKKQVGILKKSSSRSQGRPSASVTHSLDGRPVGDLVDYDDGGMDARLRDIDSAGAESLRQEFWLRQREAVLLEAEKHALAASRAKLNQQRAEIDRLRAEQARLHARREAALQLVAEHAKRQDQALRAKINSATAQAQAKTAKIAFKQPIGSSEDEEEEDGDYAYVDSEDVDDEVIPSAPPTRATSGIGSDSTGSHFLLSSKELSELADLQESTGFASVAPSSLFSIFKSQSDRNGRLHRSAFKSGANQFLRMAQTRDEPSARKAVLVLNRLFDLFDNERSGSIEYAQFATGLSIITQGDRDERIKLAFAAFDIDQSGYLSFNLCEKYLVSFFTVVFDLSVSLQESILPHTDISSLAHATTRALFQAVGRTSQISYAEFRRWYESHLGDVSERIDLAPMIDSGDENLSDFEPYDSADDDEEAAIIRATQAAAEARLFAQAWQKQQQQDKANAANSVQQNRKRV